MTIGKLSDMLIPGSLVGVQVSNIIKKKSIAKSALFRSGIAVPMNDAEIGVQLNLERGGKFLNMPFRNALSGAEQIMNDTTDLVINKLTYDQTIAAVFERANSWGITDLAVDLSGEDPMDDLTSLLADYWAERYQVQLVNILNGALGAASMSGNVTDISGLSGDLALLSGPGFITASRVFGDQSSQIRAVAMHSAVMTYLIQQNLIEYVPTSEQGVYIPKYMGKDIIEDDGMPYNSGTGVASIYMFKRGAIGFQEGTPKTPLEVDRASLTNGGQEWLVNRKKYVMHPIGLKWNTAASITDPTPNNAELATTTNWTRIYAAKEVGIAKFTFKLA